eukprot:TRINITY_DN1299_c0_g1_i1.p1 TRINITY_DN1299_c0_g1~~TRINITY_DN1299_c0_g1_i1.p1  ORF type:complete len:694 (+),score=191.78 TRINITY_DN1299_c0_g1_i1:87-2168(+)
MTTNRVYSDDNILQKQEVLDLQNERIAGEKLVNLDQLKNVLAGSEQKRLIRERMAVLIERDMLLNDGYTEYDQGRIERLQVVWRKLKRLRKIYFELLQTEEEREQLLDLVERLDRSLAMRWFVQFSLFVPTILSQGNEEQRKKWYNAALNMQMIGGFAMTELGHSSFLRGIETVAEYDAQTQQFTIESTRTTATKIWIGLTGTVATHAIVFANLVVKGKNCGIQLFMVPIRDPQTGEMLSGITVGELGPKAGRGGLDNGFIQFTAVKVPRENMLMRWAKLSADGVFTPPPTPALVYGGTVTERVGSILGTVIATESALTVATRFSIVRRQGPSDEKIIDYQTQQLRLLPSIATSNLIKLTSARATVIYNDLMSHLKANKEDYYLKHLPELHALSCGLKAFCTWWGSDCLEKCRRAMGGYGFHALSSIPSLIGEYGVMTTGGGDNVVIAQQCAAFLLKQFQYVVSGKKEKVVSSASYFIGCNENENANAIAVRSKEDLLCPVRILGIMRQVVFETLKSVSLKMTEQSGSGKQIRQIWNDNLSELVQIALLHCSQYVLESGLLVVQQLSTSGPASSSTTQLSLSQVFKQLSLIFALEQLESSLGRVLQYRLLAPEQAGWAKEHLIDQCLAIRPMTATLIDAWNIPDYILRSPLGRYDGNIYVSFLSAVKDIYKNRFPNGVVPYWETEIAPTLAKL